MNEPTFAPLIVYFPRRWTYPQVSVWTLERFCMFGVWRNLYRNRQLRWTYHLS